MSSEQLIEDMAREIMDLRQEVERLSKMTKLYQIGNVKLSETLAADQNNYTLGNYDVIKLGPTANRTINGITNGTKGRFLWIYNASTTFTISFSHQSASANLGNRIVTGTSGTIVLGTRKTALFMYDSDPGFVGTNVWIMFLPGA